MIFVFLKKKVFKKVLKSFRRVLKSKICLKSYIFKKVQKVGLFVKSSKSWLGVRG
jgi:hypothetical protein